MIFDKRLTKLRKEMNINQKECAALLEIEGSKYNKWENGKTVPDFETVIKLAIFFGVTVDYLIGNSDAKKSNNENIMNELGLSEEAIKGIKVITSTPEGKDILNEILKAAKFQELIMEIEYLEAGYSSYKEAKELEKNAIFKISTDNPNDPINAHEYKLWFSEKTVHELIPLVLDRYYDKKKA